jgi:hypothetical protein
VKNSPCTITLSLLFSTFRTFSQPVSRWHLGCSDIPNSIGAPELDPSHNCSITFLNFLWAHKQLSISPVSEFVSFPDKEPCTMCTSCYYINKMISNHPLLPKPTKIIQDVKDGTDVSLGISGIYNICLLVDDVIIIIPTFDSPYLTSPWVRWYGVNRPWSFDTAVNNVSASSSNHSDYCH